MKTLITAAAALVFAVGTASAANMSFTQKSLVKLEISWSQAMVGRNAAILDGILAPSWTQQDVSGKPTNKRELLADLKSGKLRVTSMRNHNLHVRVYGEFAIVQGADTERSSYAGKDTSGEYTWMDVFMKHDGKWRAVASQTSHVTPKS
jgi:hypothetical protein